MENRRWPVRIAGAGVWVLAALTWGSITHHLLGLPDLGPVIALVAVVAVLVLPVSGTRPSRRSARSTTSLKQGHPSRP